LKRDQRIRGRRFFQLIFKKGRFTKGSFLNVWFYQVEKGGSRKPQIAMMVSRKAARRAVDRNLWRRRIRESFREEQERLKPGSAIIVQSRIFPTVPSYHAIRNEMKKVFLTAGCYR